MGVTTVNMMSALRFPGSDPLPGLDRPDAAAWRQALVIGMPWSEHHAPLLEALCLGGCEVRTALDLAQARDQLRDGGLAFLLLGDLPVEQTCQLAGELLQRHPNLTLVPVVGYADQERAAALLELGCTDYLLAPFGDGQVEALLCRLVRAARADQGFVTRSRTGRRLLALAQRMALSRTPVLITGETGTGKELMARYVHHFSATPDAPFVAVNCAAIPESMLESILFGHERGAFTGAVSAQPGKFELANGGTLLLDEVGELPLALQAKLLRVLQEQRVERLGGRREIELDVRIIAATNRDLQAEVAAGRFRADLMFRLDVLALHIPPLRERPEDVLPLAQALLAKHAPQDAGRELLTAEASRLLLQHDWPGNVRELENCLQRALVLRNGLYIQPGDLRLQGAQPVPRDALRGLGLDEGGRAALRASAKLAEYQHVIDTIRRCGGHKSKAAASLGMTPRALRYRLSAMRQQGVVL
ncbi:sigma-54-dependent transcriptional regulator [Metapseudomonas otitidis]|uniref:sigma-54-dependent transcriptional regulator n=1 Tax=Metapseudomonas otitidis TaxID=319939 RepID=UPI001F2E5B45|nr:sigma-54 dependent transcriptional regulator [Pseudomonas otitidis]